VHVAASLAQQVNDRCMLGPDGEHQWRVAVVVLDLCVRAVVDQQLGKLRVAVLETKTLVLLLYANWTASRCKLI
jgi:hypothetical protein